MLSTSKESMKTYTYVYMYIYTYCITPLTGVKPHLNQRQTEKNREKQRQTETNRDKQRQRWVMTGHQASSVLSDL